jgi:lauroyl/myristoyl acyltransferase
MPGGARDAMHQMENVLRHNKILSVTAIGSGKNAIGVPLLGGTLSLARGVPSLAERTGASVIPTAVTILPGPRYVVEFETPLEIDSELSGPEFEKVLVSAYARRLTPRLRARPGSWRGWLMAHTWGP